MKNLFNRIAIKIRNAMNNGLVGRNPDRFLKDISGIVHVGANIGQERELYQRHNLGVIWIEPIPEVFDRLIINIKDYKNQRAFQALITDVANKKYEFHIANNNGASSSIYDLKDHKDIWPEVGFQETISLESITLTTLFKKELVDLSEYQALIMDTQGSELLVLKGSIPILKHFKYIKTEVADFESYEGCCTLSQIEDFMLKHGYEEFGRKIFAQRARGGRYYDIVFKRINSEIYG